MLPGANGAGIINVTDAAQAWLGGAWPGSTSPNVIYGPGLGNTAISNVVVTDSNFNNTFGAITTTNSYIKIFGTGFVSNTTVLVNANSVPVTGVTFTSSEELRVALPTIANNQTVTFNVINAGPPKFTSVFTQVIVDYLIVAGGGSGAYGGPAVTNGGGGAGGLFTGTQTLTTGATYPIVVGSGGFGAGPTAGGFKSGNNSSAFGFTAFGGGAGGPGGSPGVPGGSGGGGSSYCFSGPAGKIGGTGVTGQGFPGGTGTCTPGLPVPAAGKGGGGGGASLAGKPGALGSAGGCGILWPFTNSYYGGGGGGSYALAGGGLGGDGGLGGGAPGNGNSANSQGQVFTGGGGGGNSSPSPKNLSGGPGVVIIATPGAFYPKISVPAGLISSGNVVITTPPAAPGSTVITFRGSGCFSVTS
jgi:hypothetical protein